MRAKAANDAHALNELCWAQATVDVSLGAALADCDAALKLSPGAPQYVDSRAFVLLRLGRYRDAVTDYTAAVDKDPSQAMSLFGRGLAKLRDGDSKGGQADLDAARAIGFELDDAYQSYGVRP